MLVLKITNSYRSNSQIILIKSFSHGEFIKNNFAGIQNQYIGLPLDLKDTIFVEASY